MSYNRKYSIYLDGGKNGLYYLLQDGSWTTNPFHAARLIKTDALYWLERKQRRFGNRVHSIPAPYGGNPGRKNHDY